MRSPLTESNRRPSPYHPDSRRFSERFADLHLLLGEGPAHDVLAAAAPVLAAELADQESGRWWPAFTPEARSTGATAMFAFPLMIGTGLAMSPAITSVIPELVNILGGQQSARTIHFFVGSFLVLFLLVHIAMVCRAGFGDRVRAMITGHPSVRKERHERPVLPATAD